MNSQLRQDLVSGDWILVAPKRARRPDAFIKKEKRVKSSKESCPFEDLEKSGHGEPILIYPNKRDWEVQIVRNKYPALSPQDFCPKVVKKGPYGTIMGRGYHELVISRSHDKNFAHLNEKKARLIFRALRDRYLTLAADSCVAYISIFHNWGVKAGGSVYHPHYQIIALPIIPSGVEHSFIGSSRYFREHKKCVHCVAIHWERKYKKRIVYENDGAIVFAPFVSREPFELRICLKKHLPYFEDGGEKDIKAVVDALQKSLLLIEKKLGDPDYNFFIHTAPVLNKEKYRHYHWHIEVLPKISISAGFELGTGIEITGVDPDEAAKMLKHEK